MTKAACALAFFDGAVLPRFFANAVCISHLDVSMFRLNRFGCRLDTDLRLKSLLCFGYCTFVYSLLLVQFTLGLTRCPDFKVQVT